MLARISMFAGSVAMLVASPLSGSAAVAFLGVAAGDASSTDATLWTRAVDSANPQSTAINVQISTDASFTSGVTTLLSGTATSATDYTVKSTVTGLQSGTVYFYRFQTTDASVTSNVGKFKTAPDANAHAALHFGFSGDMDGLMRPYALASRVSAQNLDFYLNCGDVIYETASNPTGNNGASWLNSPAVTVSGDSSSLNGVPTSGTAFATHIQLFNDYTKKYREQFLPVNTGGQNALQPFYAGQGNYTLNDNHELGNRQYINGGAPAGGSVGGSGGNDMPTGRGVDARGSTPGTNPNDAADLLSLSGTAFMNRSQGFQTLEQVFLSYEPIKETRASGANGLISAPNDPRSDSTKQLYFSQPWGKNAIYIQTDTRSYRDIRMKTSNGGSDDCGPRADNAARTYLGQTQLAWLEQQLLAAEQTGTPWKFVAVSDPIDQIGPISSTSGVATLSTITGVNSDGGKSWMGGYRAERNALLKFIADRQIKNVVFLATDDHQNRINEVLYSPSSRTGYGSNGFLGQSEYVKVPYCISIVCGPLGATGPDAITDHSFSNIKAIADDLASKQGAAGIEPIGLLTYPGLHDVKRDENGTLVNETTPQPVDFYSPDTFNYNVLDVSADGKTLTVTSRGINSTAQNSALEYNAATNPERTLFQFSIDATSPLYAIDHFIVVYQENWSFDALYGSFPGANGRANADLANHPQIDRITGNALSSLSASNGFNRYSGSGVVTSNNSVAAPGFLNIPPQPLGNATGSSSGVDTRFSSNPADATSATIVNTLLPWDIGSIIASNSQTGDIVHRYWQEMFQTTGADSLGVDHGSNSGFLTWSDNPGLVMSYFDATNLPEGLLAQQYTMCDNFFHSSFGGSFLNHQFLIAAAAPVYTNMPSLNQGALAYLDSTGLLGLNASGSSAGKLIRDGSITPVAGDVLTGLTIDGTSGQTRTVIANGTPSDVSFQDGSHFDKHYVVNTSFSRNLATNTTTFATSGTGTLTSGSSVISSASGTRLGSNNVGMTITGSGIPAGTVVTAVSGSNLTISQAATTTAASVSLTFTGYPVSLIPSQDNTSTVLNIGDVLDNAGVSWKWYSGGWNNALDSSTSNPLHLGSSGPNTVNSLFQWHHQPFAFFEKSKPFDANQVDGRNVYASAHLQDEANFYTDVSNNTLPAVSFVKFLGPDNEHPGYASLQQGQQHVADLVAAVQANPALWAHTAIIVTYDEHGGRWDHVQPPVRDLWGPGVRVPALVISPFAKQGYVDHTQHDTSAILSTIEQRFGLNPLNARDGNAATLASAFTNFSVTRGGFAVNRRTNRVTQTLTVTNASTQPMSGPILIALDNLRNTTVVSATGTTANTSPTGSPYVFVSSADLAAGASATVTLQFTVPASGGITYSPRVISGTQNP
ncbi:MAG: alkaline phosphatase D family protein [Acidobacteriaceae bacterium]|nr:alkaline phosphatase D family protein [Acidobacteriaceae bacterium]